ncbi:MAG: alpha-amylase family glycosyl hydrolase, partial [Planctomycetota bacterium]
MKFREESNQNQLEIWAPKVKKLRLVDSGSSDTIELEKDQSGIHRSKLLSERPSQYFFELDRDRRFPDPRSVYLPNGVHGPSQWSNWDFQWSDENWNGIATDQLMIYELHVGAFTAEGTFSAVERELDYLEELGINAIELMPLAQCPGRWNWGYDSVGLFAVSSNYGTPKELKRLINECHRRGISVIHDVVYNHVGPEGNYLGAYAPYFSKKHGTPWGSAFDFDGPNQKHARSFVIENALY